MYDPIEAVPDEQIALAWQEQVLPPSPSVQGYSTPSHPQYRATSPPFTLSTGLPHPPSPSVQGYLACKKFLKAR